MGALIDLILQTTDPVVALLLIGVYIHIRQVRNDLRTDLRETRERVERLENSLIGESGS